MKRTVRGRQGKTPVRPMTLASVTAVAISMLVSLSLPAGASAADLSSAPATRAASSQRSCRNPHAARRPGSPCLTGPAGGAMSSIDATSLAETLLSSTVKGAGGKIGGVLAGWALDSIFGSSAPSNDEIVAQLNAMQDQMTDLQTQVHGLDLKLDASIKKLMTQSDQSTYDGAAAQVNYDAADLADYQIQLKSWLKKPPGTAVDGSQSSELQTMRSTLGVIIQHLDHAMVGAAGSRGLIAIYRSVIQSRTPYLTDRFYTSDFTTPMSDMLDYYAGLTVQAFIMLAEVNHLSWTFGGATFAANDAVVETYAELVPTMLAHWNQLATGGVGRLPQHVVADAATGLMWSRSNLTLAGTQHFCWANCGENLSISTLLTPATVIDGLSGWAIPTQTQFYSVINAATFGGQDIIKFLTASGFQWQADGGISIVVPAYWTADGTSVGFPYGTWMTVYKDWPLFLPGPGAVAVRPIH